MQRSLRILSLALFAALAFGWVPAAQAQAGHRLYQPSTVTTVQGTVKEVKTFVGGSHGLNGTVLKLKSAAGTFEVRLGPCAYVMGHGFMFVKGDRIEVTGSKLTLRGHAVIIAREVKKGGKTLTLRDEQGRPAWSQGR